MYFHLFIYLFPDIKKYYGNTHITVCVYSDQIHVQNTMYLIATIRKTNSYVRIVHRDRVLERPDRGILTLV